MNYELLAPRRIVFGWGRRNEVGALAATLGKRAFLVSGSRTLDQNGQLDSVESTLRSAGIETVRLATISREPEVSDVDSATAKLLEQNPDGESFLLAVGGGSAIDLAKAVAAMATNRHGHAVADFLEGVGRGLSLERAPLPVMALPTTGGTGSEATKNAVISSYDPLFKKSLRDDRMVPAIVLVDPELAITLPPEITAQTGMDAITQLIESYLSRKSQPIPDALCLQGLELALSGDVEQTAIVQAVEQPDSRAARETMAHAALLSGIALANSGLGMAHGVAAALGVHARVPHGLACAVMLPAALRVNREVRAEKLERLAMTCLADKNVPRTTPGRIDAFLSHVEAVSERIGIPRHLSQIGVTADQIPAIATSSRGSSMSGNPRELSDTEIVDLLKGML